MNQHELGKKLDLILKMKAFDEVFTEIQKTDSEIGGNIVTSLKNHLSETHEQITQAGVSPDKLKFAFYRETVELNSHISGFLRYTETMSQREAALWKFALDATEQFFDIIFDALDDYFSTKLEIMSKEVETDASWYSGLRDTAKKAAIPLNLAKKGIAKAANKLADAQWDEDEEILDARDLVAKLLDQHLGPSIIEADISRIMEEASKRFSDAWKKEIQAQTPDMDEIKAFAAHGVDSDLDVGFELGTAEQALLVGLGGAVVGTLGLAAGWHTITYSLLHVFPPAAIFAVVATVAVAFLTKGQAAEKRKKVITESVQQYHRYFLTQIDTAQLDELKGRTLRKAMTEQSKELIQQVMGRWNEVISGKLNVEHYRRLSAAANVHIGFIDECLDLIEKGTR